jgi:IclR family transcriptional regulator, acetate operon repressor
MSAARAGTGTRSLKTAAAVLRALRLLGDHPAGLVPAELADALGKSPATARYMANTLCHAGYAERSDDGRIRLSDAPPWGSWGSGAAVGDHEPADLAPGDAAPGSLLAQSVTDLYRLTRQRTYLVRRSGTVVATVCDSRGHQGLARVPGLSDHIPPQRAHALGLTRVLLAASSAYREAVESETLAALTPRTVTTVDGLRRVVDRVRRCGWAVDDGEFADGFATLAAPVVSPSGTSTVAIGLSCSSRRLAVDRDELVDAVLSVSASATEAWASV